MVTGDNKNTAIAIAKSADILEQNYNILERKDSGYLE